MVRESHDQTICNTSRRDLLTEFLDPMGITANRLADATGLPTHFIREIIAGREPILAVTAARLGKFFNMSAQFWVNLQSDYDRRLADS